MPKGHYTTETRLQWTPAMVQAALGDFVARTQRLPQAAEWQAAYGLPSRRTVERLYGSREVALASYLTMHDDATPLAEGRSSTAWHFGAGRPVTANDTR